MFTSGHFGFEVPEDNQGKVPEKWLVMPAQGNSLVEGTGLGVICVQNESQRCHRDGLERMYAITRGPRREPWKH